MTTRTQILLKRLLMALETRDGIPLVDTILHAEVGLNIDPPVRLTEFELLIGHADSHGWLRTITNQVTGKSKYAINDAGRNAILDL